MEVNTLKTKVVIFGRRKGNHEADFIFGNKKVEVVSEYTYLGIFMSCNGNMSKNIARLKNLESRAMFAIIKKARRLNLDVDVQLHLFDTMVLPIALYGSEIWGHVNFEMIERLHLQFCKMLLKVKKCTPTCMVLGELGRLPI